MSAKSSTDWLGSRQFGSAQMMHVTTHAADGIAHLRSV